MTETVIMPEPVLVVSSDDETDKQKNFYRLAYFTVNVNHTHTINDHNECKMMLEVSY